MDLAAKLLCAATAAIYATGSPLLHAQSTSVLHAQVAAYTDPDPAPFFIHGLSNKCIDAGIPQARFAGQPVVVSDCNGTPAQQIDIVEISADHRVVLKASDYCVGPKGGALTIGVRLELQLCDATDDKQQFVIDGDSIISLATIPANIPARHRLVVSVSGGKFANGSSLVLIERTLDDAEFWSFVPTFGPLTGNVGASAPITGQARPITNIPPGGFRQKPTTGFVSVKTLEELLHALAPAGVPALPGTVIELAADIALDGVTSASLVVPERVTIRGGRHGLQPGFAIVYPSDFSLRDPIFIVQGADARITGVRIIGPSRDTKPDLPRLNGILVVQDANSMPPASRTVIDHNELSQFTNASIRIEGGPDWFSAVCLEPRDYHLRPPNVEVVRNFIHDNRAQAEGYGVEVAGGAHALIEANTFAHNR